MFKLQLYIYCASIWPWFAVNYLLYIFVILYKNVTWKSFLKKKKKTVTLVMFVFRLHF